MTSRKQELPESPSRTRRVALHSDFNRFLGEIGSSTNRNGRSAAGQRTRQRLLKLLEARGGETLAGSGFEAEESEPGFAND